jgi:CubicO group peptidase (beta-lactamase class C family)
MVLKTRLSSHGEKADEAAICCYSLDRTRLGNCGHRRPDPEPRKRSKPDLGRAGQLQGQRMLERGAGSNGRRPKLSTDDRIEQALSDLRRRCLPEESGSNAYSLSQGMAELSTPGAGISLIDDFEVAWARGFGTRSSGAQAPVTEETLFQAGSISKLVFALAVMRLAQDGVVDLDKDVNGYLKSWKVGGKGGWRPSITLRQLLSHTAGVTVHGFPGYPAAGPWPTVAQVLDGTPPANTEPIEVGMLPSLQFCYSGGGTLIAQQAIVDHLRRPFEELMHELVCDPLGMRCSSFDQPLPLEFAQRAAIGHPWNEIAIEGGWNVYPELAAAGLWTTPSDLAKLSVDVMRAYCCKTSALGLRPESIRSMFHTQLPKQNESDEYVGLGWFCTNAGDDLRCGHRGWNHGFVAEMILYPARGQGAVIMLNSNRGAPLRADVLDALGREYGWPRKQPTKSAARDPAAYSGSYRHPAGVDIEITQRDGGRLQLLYGRQPPVALFSSSEAEFSAVSLELKIRFHRNADGRVTGATLSQGDSNAELTKTQNVT